MPRVKGYRPGSPSFTAGSNPGGSPGPYTGSRGSPDSDSRPIGQGYAARAAGCSPAWSGPAGAGHRAATCSGATERRAARPARGSTSVRLDLRAARPARGSTCARRPGRQDAGDTRAGGLNGADPQTVGVRWPQRADTRPSTQGNPCALNPRCTRSATHCDYSRGPRYAGPNWPGDSRRPDDDAWAGRAAGRAATAAGESGAAVDGTAAAAGEGGAAADHTGTRDGESGAAAGHTSTGPGESGATVDGTAAAAGEGDGGCRHTVGGRRRGGRARRASRDRRAGQARRADRGPPANRALWAARVPRAHRSGPPAGGTPRRASGREP